MENAMAMEAHDRNSRLRSHVWSSGRLNAERQKLRFAGWPGTWREPMNRVAGVILAGVVFLLVVFFDVPLAQSQVMCPQAGQPSVPCDFSGNCFHSCCLSTGVCAAFSCTASLDAPNDAGAICTHQCQQEIACRPFNPAHLAGCPNGQVCIGTLVCRTADCDGRQAGDICLMAGQVIKVCSTVTD